MDSFTATELIQRMADIGSNIAALRVIATKTKSDHQSVNNAGNVFDFKVLVEWRSGKESIVGK